jgi:hypothetical protein
MQFLNREQTTQTLYRLFSESEKNYIAGLNVFNKLVKLPEARGRTLELNYSQDTNILDFIQELEINYPQLGIQIIHMIQQEMPEVDFYSAQHMFMIKKVFSDLLNGKMPDNQLESASALPLVQTQEDS